MIIQQATAIPATSAANNFLFTRQAVAPLAEKIADTTTISQAAQDRLAFEKATGLQIPDELFGFLQERSLYTFEKPSEPSVHTTSTFRVDGPVYRFEDVVKSKGGPLIAVKMTDAQVNELKLREQQEMARQIVSFNYAKAHQYQPVGQVLVNGKLIATVSDAGSVELPHAISGLSDLPLSPADRLAEIARAVNGKIIYSNFLPTMGGWMGPSAPESMLPPLTARSMREIFDQEIAPAMEKKITEWEAQTGKTYPRRP